MAVANDPTANSNEGRRAKIVYRDVNVDFIDGGYFCRIPIADVAIDADGAPDAYGPPRFDGDRDGCGTDSLKHAGYPDNSEDPIPDYWPDVLAPDPDDPLRPFLKDDGYFISKTSLFDDTLASDLTPGKFVDANHVSYFVMPRFWIDHLGVQLGDLCLLWHSTLQMRAVAIVADLCPVDEPLGEMSIAAARQLGGRDFSPLTGVDFPEANSILCYIFKGSRPRLEWPLTNDFVQSFLPDLERRLGLHSVTERN